MNTDPIRLAALDLDGTLLDRTSKITPRTLEAIVTGHPPGRGGPARHRAGAVGPAPGGGLHPRRTVRPHLQRGRRLGPGARPHGRRPQPLRRARPRAGGPAVCLYRRTLPAETAGRSMPCWSGTREN